MKTTKILGILAGLLLVVYLFKDKIFGFGGGSSSADDINSDLITDNNTYSSPPKDPNIDKWVKVGSKGDAVKQVQQLVNKVIKRAKYHAPLPDYLSEHPNFSKSHVKVKKYDLLVEDGVFGSKTKDVVYTLTMKAGTSKRIMQDKLKAWEFATDDKITNTLNQSYGGAGGSW